LSAGLRLDLQVKLADEGLNLETAVDRFVLHVRLGMYVKTEGLETSPFG
jgi:hypothetical protein